MSIWKEIRNHHTDDNGVTYIDAYLTEDDNEVGKVIAFVLKGEIYYKDDRARDDGYAQIIINETIEMQKISIEVIIDAEGVQINNNGEHLVYWNFDEFDEDNYVAIPMVNALKLAYNNPQELINLLKGK